MAADAAEKVTTEHLRRAAYLYVRQSTMRQVVCNTTSTDRQYGLRQRAVALGWPAEQVVVIDEDLGRSGAPPPRAVTASSGWSPTSAWDGPASCSAWRSPGWLATTPTGTGCWRSAR